MRTFRPVRMTGPLCGEILSAELPTDKNPIETLCQITLIRNKALEILPIIGETETVEELFEALLIFPFPTVAHEPLVNLALRLKDSMLDLILRKAMERLMELQKNAPEPN